MIRWRKIICIGVGAFLCQTSVVFGAQLSIRQAIDLAWQQDSSIKISQQNEGIAAAALQQAKGNNGLSLSTNADVSHSVPEEGDTASTLSNSLTASLPVYSGGANEAMIESENIGMQMAVLHTAREKENVRLRVLDVYYDVLGKRKKVAIAQDAVNIYRLYAKNTGRTYFVKYSGDALRVAVAFSNAKQELLNAENDYEISVRDLKNLLHLAEKEPLLLTDDFSVTAFEGNEDHCVNYALKNRKDLMIDQYGIRQKQLAVKTEQAGFLPSLNMSVTTDLTRGMSTAGYTAHGYTAGINAQWDLFDNGITKAKVRAAKEEVRIAELNLEKDQDAVRFAVRQACFSIRNAETRLASSDRLVKQSKKYYAMEAEKYHLAGGVLLNRIDAVKFYLNAQFENIAAKYDYAKARASLFHEMGEDVL
jgi:outer membrane protein